MSNAFIVISGFMVGIRMTEKVIFGKGVFADDYLILLSYVWYPGCPLESHKAMGGARR
jgi:hypothetical protein